MRPFFLQQFRPMVPGQPGGQHFVPSASQPFHHPYGHVPPNVQSQPPPQFSQPMQQQLFPVRPGQPGHITSSSQPLTSPYVQTNMILTSGSTQPQPNAPPMTGFGSSGPPFSSSYTVRPLLLFFLYMFFGWPFSAIWFVFTLLDSCFSSLYHRRMVSNNHHPWSNQPLRCMQLALLQQLTLGLFL